MTREELEQIAGLDFSEPANVEIARKAAIGGMDSLEWAMGVLAEAEERKARIVSASEEAFARIVARRDDLIRKVDGSAQFLRYAVEEYARTHRKELIKGRPKTVDLIHGAISYRVVPERIDVENAEATLEWARAQPVEADMVRVKYEINKRALTEHFKATGEIPPGCVVHPESESIIIRPEQPETLNLAPSRKEIEP